MQIIMLNLTNLVDPNDSTVQILKYISTVISVQEIIVDTSSYEIAVIIVSILTLISLLCIIYLFISVRIGKFFVKIPIDLLNVINVVVMNYLIGPIVHVSILSTKCSSGVHDFLLVSCYSNYLHIVFIILSLINIIFFVALSVILSIYSNEIGSLNETKVMARVNTNYEVFTNISKISIFIFAYFVKFYGSGSDTYKIILQIYILLTSGYLRLF